MKYLFILLGLGAAVGVAWFFMPKWFSDGRTLVSRVTYSCDGGKTIHAAFYEGKEAPTPQPGEPPIPTGSVEVSLNGEPTLTLVQTLSASGVRYANTDESLVFWNKGEEALIMRNNEMDLTYTNCKAN